MALALTMQATHAGASSPALLGIRGRKTGWMPKENCLKDADGMDDLDEWFATSDEEEEEYIQVELTQEIEVEPDTASSEEKMDEDEKLEFMDVSGFSEISVFGKKEKSPPPLDMTLTPILPPSKLKSRKNDPPRQPSFVATPHRAKADLPLNEISDESFLVSDTSDRTNDAHVDKSADDSEALPQAKKNSNQPKETKSEEKSSKSLGNKDDLPDSDIYKDKQLFNKGKRTSTKPIKIVISGSEYADNLPDKQDSDEEHLEKRGKKRSTANLITDNKDDKRLKTARGQEEGNTIAESLAHQDEVKVVVQNKRASKNVRQEKDIEEEKKETSMDKGQEEEEPAEYNEADTVDYPVHYDNDNYSVVMDNQEEEMEDNYDSGDAAPSPRTGSEQKPLHLESKSRGEKVTHIRKHISEKEEEEEEEEFQEIEEEEDEEYEEDQSRDQKKGKRRDFTEDNWQGADASGEVFSEEETVHSEKDDSLVYQEEKGKERTGRGRGRGRGKSQTKPGSQIKVVKPMDMTTVNYEESFDSDDDSQLACDGSIWQPKHEIEVSSTVQRRSTRTKIKPLEYWRNERVIYQDKREAVRSSHRGRRGVRREEVLPAIKEIIRVPHMTPIKKSGGRSKPSK